MKAHRINIPALVLSMHDESLYAERSLRAGARGYVTKDATLKISGQRSAPCYGEKFI